MFQLTTRGPALCTGMHHDSLLLVSSQFSPDSQTICWIASSCVSVKKAMCYVSMKKKNAIIYHLTAVSNIRPWLVTEVLKNTYFLLLPPQAVNPQIAIDSASNTSVIAIGITVWYALTLKDTVLPAELPSSASLHIMHKHTKQTHCASGSLLTFLNLQGPTKDGTLIRVPEPKKEMRDRERLEGGEKRETGGSAEEWQLMTVATSCDL